MDVGHWESVLQHASRSHSAAQEFRLHCTRSFTSVSMYVRCGWKMEAGVVSHVGREFFKLSNCIYCF